MKKLLVVFFIFFILTNVVHAEADNSYIPDGTIFAVELVNSVNSKSTFIGEALEISVLENVIVGNTVVIEEGSRGYVMVSNVKKAGDWGKAGGIEIQPQYVRTVNSVIVPLTNNIAKSGDGHDLVRPFGIGAIGKNLEGSDVKLGSILMFTDFTPGRNAEIPAGTKFIVSVNGNVDLNLSQISSHVKKKLDWTGRYTTSRGKMIITQDGNRVVGHYDRGEGKIEGRVVGNKLVGQWTETKSKIAPTGKGFFEFKIGADDKVIMLWRNDGSNNWFIDPYVTTI